MRVDVIGSEGDRGVMKNLRRKAEQADRMFSSLVDHMNEAERIQKVNRFTNAEKVPSWL